MKAIILCGGKGESLRPLTDKTPKPLVKVNKMPIIVHIINHLSFHGVKDIILATGYMAESFEEFFQNHKLDAKIELVDTGDKDIIDRILSTQEMIGDKFLVLYGDTISNIDVTSLINFHKNHYNPATISVWPLETQFGLVEIDENYIVKGFKEKPRLDKWINIGYFCFENEIYEEMKKYSTFEHFLLGVTNKKLLTAFKHEGIHLTINTLQELDYAEKEISSNFNHLGASNE